jgi:Tfp pilus assembly major pilin PilA
MFCSKCGKEISEGSSFCQHCGGNLSVATVGTSSQIMTAGLTVDDFATFVGKNSEKYLPKFAKFNAGGIDSFKTTWHWPAFFLSFWWLLYRKLYGWAAIAFFLPFIVVFSLSLTGMAVAGSNAAFYPLVSLVVWAALLSIRFGWAIFANRLYYNHTKKKLHEIKQLHPAPETQKAVITVSGGTGNVAVVLGAVIGSVAVIGILAAIAIPGYLGMQERSRKAALTRAISAAQPELQTMLANGEIRSQGVCTQYVSSRTEKSPWDVNTNLWSINQGNGQIQCMQNTDNSLTLTGFDKNGGIIGTKTLTGN